MVRLWDLERRKLLQELRAVDNVNAVQFAPDATRLFAGSSDGSLQAWRVSDGTQLMLLGAHDFAVSALEVAPDGHTGVTASIDETVQLWDLDQGEPLGTLYGHEGPVLAVALSPDGGLVASGGVDGTVRVWRRGDGDRLHVYGRHSGPVWSVAFSPDGKTVLSGGADGLVLTYDLSKPDDAAPAPAQTVAAASPHDAGRGAELFRACAACHTVAPGNDHRAGPTLYRLFGRIAGSHPGYPYSSALEESDLIWTEETVARLFEVGPEVLVPGSKMPLQRMPSAKDRADLVAYLKEITMPDSGK
jgi:cytochrome c